MTTTYASEQDIRDAYEAGRLSRDAAVRYLREVRYAAGGNVTHLAALDTIAGWSRPT